MVHDTVRYDAFLKDTLVHAAVLSDAVRLGDRLFDAVLHDTVLRDTVQHA